MKHIIYPVALLIASCGTSTAVTQTGTDGQATDGQVTRGSTTQGSSESGDLYLVMPDGRLVPYPTSVQIVTACVVDGVLQVELHNISKVAGQFKLEINGVKTDYSNIQAQATIYAEFDVPAAKSYSVFVLSDHTSIGGSAEQQTNAWYSWSSSNACP